jgi:lipid-A-disaccharide synthase
MRIFVSAGEPSGDLHGGNLIRILRQLAPEVECLGFGGERMHAAGCRLLFPLAQLSAMFIIPVLLTAHKFLKLLVLADRAFRQERPDALVLIDYPGFHWWLARRAQAHGIPVFYFVPPQLWAWAGWRVKKMRRLVDHVLCSLPFEEAWYRERGIHAHYLGHPYFDELPRQQLDWEFVQDQRARAGRVVGLLPGSRTQEIKHNLSTLMRAAAFIHAELPNSRFLVACYRDAHYAAVARYLADHPLPFVEPWLGRTPEIVHLSEACIAVSGSVGLELLYRRKPSVVVYRVNALVRKLAARFLTIPHIGLVNLLAGKELFPEFMTDRCEAQAVADCVLRWLTDGNAYQQIMSELGALADKITEPGACERTARYILAALKQSQLRRPRHAA